MIDLKGLRILNPRGDQPSNPLLTAIKESHGQLVHYPVMHIQPIHSQHWQPTLPEHANFCIFTSPNAVDCFFCTKKKSLLPAQCFSIGKATQQRLQHHDIHSICPPEANSESLLALIQKQFPKTFQALIIKGEGGREALVRGIQNMGSSVSVAEVYRREKNTPPLSETNNIWRNDAVDIILGTSAFVIDGILESFASNGRQWIEQKPWLVFGPRLQKHAKEKGVVNLLQCPPEGVLQTLSTFSQGLRDGN